MDRQELLRMLDERKRRAIADGDLELHRLLSGVEQRLSALERQVCT